MSLPGQLKAPWNPMIASLFPVSLPACVPPPVTPADPPVIFPVSGDVAAAADLAVDRQLDRAGCGVQVSSAVKGSQSSNDQRAVDAFIG